MGIAARDKELFYCPRCGKRWAEAVSQGVHNKKACPECGSEFDENTLKREAGKAQKALREEKREKIKRKLKEKLK